MGGGWTRDDEEVGVGSSSSSSVVVDPSVVPSAVPSARPSAAASAFPRLKSENGKQPAQIGAQ